MTKTRSLIRASALAMPLLLAAASAFADPPQPKIVVLDRRAIMQFSKAGQDIAKQMQAYSNQAKNDLAARGKALQNEGRTLQQQVAILAPDLKAKKLADFQAREQALQGEVQKKDEQMRYAYAVAQQTMEQKLGPILQQIVKQRGANLVIDKQAVVFAPQAQGFDITIDCIKQLDQQMPSLKVNFSAPVPAAAKK
jgi:Skp family chaperone for outer membrane proteins